MRLGIVSDTHGLVRPELLTLFRGVSAILHAGDVGGGHVLEALEKVAPTHAVRGNVDGPDLPERLEIELGGQRFGVMHGHRSGARSRVFDLSAAYPQADFLVYGHTHKAESQFVFGVGTRQATVVNPGSAGPRRFSLPVTAAVLDLAPGASRLTLYQLEAGRWDVEWWVPANWPGPGPPDLPG